MNREATNILVMIVFITFLGSNRMWAQPSNDDPCSSALLIAGSGCSFSLFSTLDATDSGLPLAQCAGYSGGDVWFKVEIPSSGNLIARIESEAIDQFPNNEGWAFRLGLAVYTGDCNSLTYDTCRIDPSGIPPVSPEVLLIGYTPGDTLFLRVWEHSNNDNGDFRICLFSDEEVPTITCSANIINQADPGLCSTSVVVPLPAADDNYGIAGVINDYNGTSDASDTYPAGVTTVTWTVTDLSGNDAICMQNINVEDSQFPLIGCLPDTVLTAGEGVYEMEVSLAAPFVSDNCGIQAITNDFNGGNDASGIYPVGTTIVNYTVSDQNGNSSHCSQQVTIRLGSDIPHGLVIPEGFSPNNDGLNDTFEIIGIGSYRENELYVFNIWGKEVYYKDAYDNSWDGSASSGVSKGQKLPSATYFYILKLGNEQVVRGSVYLIKE